MLIESVFPELVFLELVFLELVFLELLLSELLFSNFRLFSLIPAIPISCLPGVVNSGAVLVLSFLLRIDLFCGIFGNGSVVRHTLLKYIPVLVPVLVLYFVLCT